MLAYMTREFFEQLVAEEYPRAVPERFQGTVRNVVFLAEEEPSLELRREEGLRPGETLLGHYRGVPLTARGEYYGVGAVLPDTITLFRKPLMAHALELAQERGLSEEEAARAAIRETIWHEVAHHFGYDERQVREKEARRHR